MGGEYVRVWLVAGIGGVVHPDARPNNNGHIRVYVSGWRPPSGCELRGWINRVGLYSSREYYNCECATSYRPANEIEMNGKGRITFVYGDGRPCDSTHDYTIKSGYKWNIEE